MFAFTNKSYGEFLHHEVSPKSLHRSPSSTSTPTSNTWPTHPTFIDETFQTSTHNQQKCNDGAGPFFKSSREPYEGQSTTSAINQMPTELLGEIFTQCIRPESSHLPYHRPRLTSNRSNSSPLSISQVCAHWRHISLSMATLWSAIEVRRPNVCMVQVIGLWLQRARDCPLSVRILQDHDVAPAEHAATEVILSLLVERVHLWKSIDFQFSIGPYHSLLGLPEGAANMLESVLLDVRHWDHASADQLWRVIHASPTLRQADWFGFDEPELPSHAPWSQLTHIKISRLMTEEEVMELVKVCPAVVVLDLPFLRRSSTPVESARVTLPNLRTLRFATSASDYATMFENLVLPALVCLDIKHAYGRSSTGALLFINGLLDRSLCRLQTFTLCDGNMEEDEFLRILALPTLHALTELELMACITDKTAVSLTSQSDSKDCLLPHLKAMTFGESRTSDGVLSNMVISRLPKLKAFQVEDVFQGTELFPKLSCTRDSLVIDGLRREGYDFYLSLEHLSPTSPIFHGRTGENSK